MSLFGNLDAVQKTAEEHTKLVKELNLKLDLLNTNVVALILELKELNNFNKNTGPR